VVVVRPHVRKVGVVTVHELHASRPVRLEVSGNINASRAEVLDQYARNGSSARPVAHNDVRACSIARENSRRPEVVASNDVIISCRNKVNCSVRALEFVICDYTIVRIADSVNVIVKKLVVAYYPFVGGLDTIVSSPVTVIPKDITPNNGSLRIGVTVTYGVARRAVHFTGPHVDSPHGSPKGATSSSCQIEANVSNGRH